MACQGRLRAAKTAPRPVRPFSGRRNALASLPSGSRAALSPSGGGPVMAGAAPSKRHATAGRFRLTYATMFDPPEALHRNYERALARVRGVMGREHAMSIGGRDVICGDKFEDRSPINTD